MNITGCGQDVPQRAVYLGSGSYCRNQGSALGSTTGAITCTTTSAQTQYRNVNVVKLLLMLIIDRPCI